MIVCLCRRIPDRVIADVILSGASTVEDVSARCGAGTDCGCCRATISRLCAAAATMGSTYGVAPQPCHTARLNDEG